VALWIDAGRLAPTLKHLIPDLDAPDSGFTEDKSQDGADIPRSLTHIDAFGLTIHRDGPAHADIDFPFIPR
jgi:hypothetical protein